MKNGCRYFLENRSSTEFKVNNTIKNKHMHNVTHEYYCTRFGAHFNRYNVKLKNIIGKVALVDHVV